jgi:hypothetical protein
MCGSRADTREHVFKKSALESFFGAGPYRGDNGVVHVKNGKAKHVQGPDSERAKYTKILCAKCNNVRSQPFDRAFDRFVKYFRQNDKNIVCERFIDFEQVYRERWPEEQTNLFKYFVKSLGCRIADAGLSVPRDLVLLFDFPVFCTALKITFAVNEDMALLPECDLGLLKGDLFGKHVGVRPPDCPTYIWHENNGWLAVLRSKRCP